MNVCSFIYLIVKEIPGNLFALAGLLFINCEILNLGDKITFIQSGTPGYLKELRTT